MTDTFIIDEKGEFVVGKAQSTPEDESVAVVNSMADALKHRGRTVEEVVPELQTGVYSGTAMLNRLVQRKGRRIGLIVNRGMEDFFRMGRGVQSYLGYSYEDRLHLNTHRYDPPLVPRHLTRGVTERIDMFGEVVIPLREDEARETVEYLLAQGVEAIVISLLHSYANPTHERRVRDIANDIIRNKGLNVKVFASCDYYPSYRELQRTNTVVVEAYAAEPSRVQLQAVNDRIRSLGGQFEMRVMASHGGTISIRANELARTLVSGPIGGVIGAKYLGKQLGYENIVCSDIGGTSFDVALITRGEHSLKYSPDIGRLVLSIPLLFMDSIGAGTGSYVRIDPYSGAITLGPDSAGYRVGVCWDKGGVDTVTVTDCHVVTGYINPDYFLGGQVKLDRDRARRAVKEQLADPLGLSVEEAAAGVISLLDYQLRNYLNSIISGKGYSPRDFVLFSYGGGGPLHTYGYTEGLGFQDILIPAWAAGFSAFGCGAADFEYRYDATLFINVPPNATEEEKLEAGRRLQHAWEELAEKVLSEFLKAGVSRDDVSFQYGFRMMYQGQLNDLEVTSPIDRIETAADWDRLTNAFEELYSRVYAKAARVPEFGFSITSAIVRGKVDTVKPKIPDEPLQGERPDPEARKGTRRVYWRGEWVEASIWEMSRLHAGNRLLGPAIIEDPATTLVVPPGYSVSLDRHRIFHLQESA